MTINRDKKIDVEYRAELQRQENIHQSTNLSLIDKVRIKALAKHKATERVTAQENITNETNKNK